MLSDLSPQVVALVVFAALAASTLAVIAIGSGRGEELSAGLDVVLPPAEPEPAPQEDYLRVWDEVLTASDQEIAERLRVLDETTEWAGLARNRHGRRRQIPSAAEPSDIEKEGL